jgi:phosphoribosylanthranilate isomerase
VSTGVEAGAKKGVKDLARMRAFVAAVRAADAGRTTA